MGEPDEGNVQDVDLISWARRRADCPLARASKLDQDSILKNRHIAVRVSSVLFKYLVDASWLCPGLGKGRGGLILKELKDVRRSHPKAGCKLGCV